MFGCNRSTQGKRMHLTKDAGETWTSGPRDNSLGVFIGEHYGKFYLIDHNNAQIKRSYVTDYNDINISTFMSTFTTIEIF